MKFSATNAGLLTFCHRFQVILKTFKFMAKSFIYDNDFNKV